MRNHLIASLVAATALSAAACGESTAPNPVGYPWVVPGVQGTVRFLDLEGGCWAIEVGGTNYQPLDLSAEFLQDGLAVETAFKERNDMGSTCMIGPIVEVLWIRQRG